MNKLRKLWEKEGILVMPGVYDGLSALIAQRSGFKALYISGGAISRSMGLPDLGLVTMTEMVKRIQEITSRLQVPVLADADTGYGNVLNVMRTVKELKAAGVSGFHLEDQITPKKCGHYEGQLLITREEMVQKIKAAKEALEGEDLLLVARTDARAVDGLEEAISRGNAYLKAGAHMIFVEAPKTRDEIELIAQKIKGPLLINIFKGGRTPLIEIEELKKLGYKIVIMPSLLQRVAIKGMIDVSSALFRGDAMEKLEESMVTFQERDSLLHLQEYRKWEGSIEKRGTNAEKD